VNEIAACWEQPLLPTAEIADCRLPIADFSESGQSQIANRKSQIANGDLFPYLPTVYPGIEAALRTQFGRWLGHRAAGFLDFGDYPQQGGSGRENFTNNNEPDFIHSLFLQYLRTGERMYYEEAEAGAWHTMDVDTIHFSTRSALEVGGQRIHGDNHVQYDCEGLADVSLAPSHQWTEGLLDYYYLSGHPRALELARGVADCFVRLTEQGWTKPPYPVAWHGVRNSGWALIGLLAVYEATREERYLAACREIVEAVAAFQREDGNWTMELGFHQGVAPLQTGTLLTGLMHYHRVTGEDRGREIFLRGIDGFLAAARYPDGAFMYVTTPGYRQIYYSGMTLESFGYAYHLTGDAAYLHAGLSTLRHGLFDAAHGGGPSLGGHWRGILRFMYWCDQAGVLRDWET
jgi:hypothetical protein